MMTYQAAAAATTTTTVPPVAPPALAPSTTSTTTPELTPAVAQASPAATSTATPKVASVSAPRPTTTGNSERGQATWYAAAPPGRCASPTLPFGTVVTVTNASTGAHTTCVVDDREQAGYPRVVDMSPSGFDQLAETSQGVVDVIISW